VRRIITGHNSEGKSKIFIDSGPARSIGEDVGGLFEIWNTDSNTINSTDTADVADSEIAQVHAEHHLVDTTKHPAMHKTDSIDYIILLKGDVSLILDEDEVRLKPFDVVVQRGTNHAWVNHGDEPALLIAVLIDAEIK
jgi:mannose-6-phosphate isomerase-like protein (cupin superfamily)